MELLATLQRDQQPIFVTLTYPNEFPTYHEDFKRHFEMFWHRITRRWPGASALWTLEFQAGKSGANVGQIAPHYHLIIYGVPDLFPHQIERHSFAKVERQEFNGVVAWFEWGMGDLPGYTISDGRWLGAGRLIPFGEQPDRKNQDTFKRWVSRNWYDVVASGALRHYRAGTRVERIKNFHQLCGYAAKRYVAKHEVVPGLATKPGRFWGVIGRAKLPAARPEEIEISVDQAIRVRRVFRGYRRSITPADKRKTLRFPIVREFTVKLFCNADFWNHRRTELLGLVLYPPSVETLFADRIRWGEAEIRRRSRGTPSPPGLPQNGIGSPAPFAAPGPSG